MNKLELKKELRELGLLIRSNYIKKSDIKKIVDSAAISNKDFDKAEEVANKGHYLDRMIGIAKAFKLKDEENLLTALKKYMEVIQSKPHGLDGMLHGISGKIIARIEIKCPDATIEDWAKIAWGLDVEALKSFELDQARTVKKGTKSTEDLG
jgi:hypothetical protein